MTVGRLLCQSVNLSADPEAWVPDLNRFAVTTKGPNPVRAAEFCFLCKEATGQIVVWLCSPEVLKLLVLSLILLRGQTKPWLGYPSLEHGVAG